MLLPLFLVGLLALPVGVWMLTRSRAATDSGSPRAPLPPASTSASPRAPLPSASTSGGPGVGDPYFPDYGSSGYNAEKYVIAVNWDPESQFLSGTTKITARASQRLEYFYVDLALEATSARVNGRPASVGKEDFQDLRITPAEPIASGADFEVIIDYRGEPGRLLRNDETPWWTTEAEWTALGQPEVSAWWFPANDHPSDPALMDVSVRVPAGMEAISVGRLESRDTANEPDFDTWHWVARQPMATYLNFVSIGQYQLDAGVVDGRPYVYAVTEQLDSAARQSALTLLRQSGAVVRRLESLFGPYPFTELGGVVVAHELGFALETQTRPVYDSESIRDPDFVNDQIVHELAHMWFGDQVTLRQWNDIFINEGYASWAQWGYAEREGAPRTGNQRLNDAYEDTVDDREFWQVTMIDPGREELFSTVYTRGSMALQALRNVIGDAAFFTLAREWSAEPGSRSVEEWMIKAQAATTVDLMPFFQAWIFSTTAPARTAANGFR